MTPVRYFDPKSADGMNSVTGETAYTYDPIHRQTGIVYPNAATAAFAWDVASRLTGLTHSNNSETFIDRVYTLDLHGNITAMTVNAGLLPQIAPQVKRLRQNPADELTSIQTKANPGVQDWNSVSPSHDLEGNLVSNGTFTYGYDLENRLVLCDSATLREAYFYSADGSRVAAETVAGGTTNLTIFVLDHADPLRRPLAELDAQGQPLRYFVWGNGLVAQIEAGSDAIRYFHADGQGSTLALTDATAAITDQWFHDPYGETLNRTGTTATPYQWIGGHGVRTEATGLHFMRHRYYHAGLKRFMTQDPIGLAGGANLYSYGDLNPLFWLDPWGLCPTIESRWYDEFIFWNLETATSRQFQSISDGLAGIVAITMGDIATAQTAFHSAIADSGHTILQEVGAPDSAYVAYYGALGTSFLSASVAGGTAIQQLSPVEKFVLIDIVQALLGGSLQPPGQTHDLPSTPIPIERTVP